MKNNIHGFTDSYKAMCVVFHFNFAAYIVCRRYKPCELPGFVWTDCWDNKSYYVITSPANNKGVIGYLHQLPRVNPYNDTGIKIFCILCSTNTMIRKAANNDLSVTSHPMQKILRVDRYVHIPEFFYGCMNVSARCVGY